MKYVVLIIDGASGWPVTALGRRTSLEAAHIPNLDRLSREGAVGEAWNVPPGMEASSAIACMSVMGFDPGAYAGRGPIEAMAMGIVLEPGQVAMRCNFVTVTDGLMASYSAGNISSREAAELVEALREGLDDLLRPRMELHAGVSFRNILTIRKPLWLKKRAVSPGANRPRLRSGCSGRACVRRRCPASPRGTAAGARH